MPAHTRSIVHQCCQPGCTSRATVEVRDTFNTVLGDYCTRHGEAKVRLLNSRQADTPPHRTPGGRR